MRFGLTHPKAGQVESEDREVLFRQGTGAEDYLKAFDSSFWPLAVTCAQRMQNHDSRPSIEERYSGRDEYLGKIADAALELADDGYLLDRDVPAMLRAAARHWDYRTAQR